jgi:hypothetical protein
MKPDRRGSWYLLTGVVAGVAIGLLYSWLVSPVKYVDAPPYALRPDYKDVYRSMVASAYMYSHDLLRAQHRLAQLKDENPVQALNLQAQQAASEGLSDYEVSALTTLANDLVSGVTPDRPQVTPFQQGTPLSQSGQFTPTSTLLITSTTFLPATSTTTGILLEALTSTPQPNLPTTPSPTAGGSFILQETHLLCNQSQAVPLIQVELKDALGQPVPSVEVMVTWEGGQDHFFTGLQPAMNLGYGDFAMSPGITYSIQPAHGGQVVNDLASSECLAEDGSHFWGSWYLVFLQQ